LVILNTICTKRGGVDPLSDPENGHILTRAIIDTIREPLIVLDEDLRIIVASRSFYEKFFTKLPKIQGHLFYEIGAGEWNVTPLRKLLEKVIPDHKTVEGYEVSQTFPSLGMRHMIINAREVRYENGKKKMLISIYDSTNERTLSLERERLLLQKDMLLKEMRHRIANSLQIIASILLIKAGMVDSEESRSHLADAHERIMSIATVQKQLDAVGQDDKIAIAEYLTNLCNSLARSMIGGRKPITLEVHSDVGHVSSDAAVSFGLITTELVINALKHAFPDGQTGKIKATYKITKSGWIFSIEDNGVGEKADKKIARRGLGTSIVDALANQLQAKVKTKSSSQGTNVTITYSKARKIRH